MLPVVLKSIIITYNVLVLVSLSAMTTAYRYSNSKASNVPTYNLSFSFSQSESITFYYISMI